MYSFRPEPDPEERKTLELVLDQMLAAESEKPGAYESEWRHAALEESVSAGETDDGVL
jgi:hypothetical protein